VDKQIESSILGHGFFDVTTIEQKLLQLNDTSKQMLYGTTTDATNQNQTSTYKAPATTVSLRETGPKAPEITNPSGFINTGGVPITLAEYKGKNIVLVDFWTYSCINCQRTIPYVESWYAKYKDEGLVVVSIHTPEFAFEKVQSNVQAAVVKLGITYPVVMDNDYGTWNAFGNEYWPQKYLINEYGQVIYAHSGEGDYDVTEKEIQKALSELSGKPITGDVTGTIKEIIPDPGSPETYFGSNRNGYLEYLGDGIPGQSGLQNFILPNVSSRGLNRLYLGGTWDIEPEYAQSQGSNVIDYMYNAKGVYFVAGSATPMDVEVQSDGKLLPANIAGADIFYKNGKSYVTIS